VSFSTSGSDSTPPIGSEQPAPHYLFLVAVSAGVCFLVAWLYVVFLPMAFQSRDLPLWLAKKSIMDSCDLGSVAVFGDSRAVAAVMPTVMPFRVSNFAMSGTGPVETYFMVERALRCPNVPKIVIISHGPGHFDAYDGFWSLGPSLGFLSYRDLRTIDAQASRFKDERFGQAVLADGLPSALRDWLYSIRFPPFFFSSIANAYIGTRWWHNRSEFRKALETRGQALFGTQDGTSELAEESNLQVFNVSEVGDYFFSATLDALEKRNVKTLFVGMPMNESTYRRMGSQVNQGFEDYLITKQKQFANFSLIGRPTKCWPDIFFGDAWHFNNRGAQTFSEQLGLFLRARLDDDVLSTISDDCGQKISSH
jgi:hypothetical protein